MAKLIKFLKSQQVCRRIDVSERCLRDMVRPGEFPAPLKRGRKWIRWRQEDVEACLAQLDQQRQAN